MQVLKKNIIIFLLVVFSLPLLAQNSFEISGIISGENNKPLSNVTIALYMQQGATFVTGTISQNDGSFTIQFVKKGKYSLRCSYVGYEDFQMLITVAYKNINLGMLNISSSVQEIEEITIEGNYSRIVQKKDTIEYDAKSYKVNEDATLEKLIKKMPGITVDDNKVQAQGEDVKKVTIDGQEFFGDDAMIAMRNLPADIIAKIQVFDGKSRQAEFTGFMDANTSKTINIITKNPEAKFLFGRVYSGYGTDDTYNAGGTANYFNGKQRITLLGTNNNVNHQNFTSEDLIGVNQSRGGRPPGVGGGSPFGQQQNSFLVDTNEGINTTKSIGLNYIDRWGKNININASYFYNKTDNFQNKKSFKDYLYSDEEELFSNEEETTDESINFNHRLKLKFEYDINYFNSLVFTPKLSFQAFDGLGSILSKNKDVTDITNETLTDKDNIGLGYALTGDLLFMHRFKKTDRTLSVNLKSDRNTSNTEEILNYETFDFSTETITDETHQKTQTEYDLRTHSANINFTEYIGDKSQLMLNYSPSLSTSKNYKENYLLDETSSEYDMFDDQLSNSFDLRISSQKAGVTIQRHAANTTINVGLAYQNNRLKGTYLYPDLDPVNKSFHSLLPTLMLTHKFSSSTNIRMFIRSGNNLPSVTQLQETVDNSNPLQLQKGNSGLKQESYKMLLTRFGTTNLKKGRSFFSFLMLQHKNNYIGNRSFFSHSDILQVDGIELLPQVQLTTFNNYDNYFNIRNFSTYGMPVKALKSNLNINCASGFNQIPSETNDVFNYTYNTNIDIGFVLSSNISEYFDFTTSYSFANNWQSNSVLHFNETNYQTHKLGFRLNYIVKERFVFNTQSEWKSYRGLGDIADTNPLLISAFVSYKFLKSKKLETRFSVYDLLNQNLGVSRNLTSVYTEDVKTNVLKQYFMFSLVYRFNTI